MRPQVVLQIICFIFTSQCLFSQQNLEVDGVMVIHPSINDATSAGAIRWTGSDFEGWNGLQWLSLTGHKHIDSIQDIDGHIYHTIRIGNQVWMGENLRTTNYRGGTPVEQIENAESWLSHHNLNSVVGAWCWNNNDPDLEIPYGKLYNWYATQGDSICPQGWRMPTESDWLTLFYHLGGVSIAAGKMKEAGNFYWINNLHASNKSGFTGRPGGKRLINGSFTSPGNIGSWWSNSMTMDGVFGISYDLYAVDANVDLSADNFWVGKSIRCIRN